MHLTPDRFYEKQRSGAKQMEISPDKNVLAAACGGFNDTGLALLGLASQTVSRLCVANGRISLIRRRSTAPC
jgi:hypothetical protein